MNRLYYGDCLTLMQDAEIIPTASIDLIYLDPPFNSQREYNAIYKTETGQPLPDQIEAFCDMWELDTEREQAIRQMPVLMREAGIDDDVAEFWRTWLNALRGTQPRLLAYLSYMVQRLLPMRRILKPTGSIYYHCDPTASHYIKVMMDGIFGHANFQNEFIWHYGGGGASQKRWARKHDVLLFYSRGRKWVFNTDDVRTPHKWTGGQRRADGSERDKRGKLAEDVWSHHSIMPWSKERMGYPTQKPLELLERVVKASSNPGDIVLDPFAGCATTMEAAHRLGRQWIGIDIAIHAIRRVARVRLEERLGLSEGKDFTIEGVPRNVEGARDLWERDKYQFQKWAVEHADGFVTSRKTSDGGIDGRLYFTVPEPTQHGDKPLTTTLESMVLEVKGGRNVGIADVRALRGVLDGSDALMAGLIVLDAPSPTKARNFERFMADAGVEEILGIEYPRMQMLTTAELLDGRRFRTPTVSGQAFDSAARVARYPRTELATWASRAPNYLLRIVMGAGHYVHGHHPLDMDERSEGQLFTEIVSDVTEGADDTSIRSGVIGEIGCEYPLHPNEEKMLRAATRASLATGAALLIHPGRDVRAPLDALRAIGEAGGRPERTIIGHLDRTLFSDKSLLELAETGCYMEFDLFGQESSWYLHAEIDMPNDATRVDYLRTLIAARHGDRLLVAQDICRKTALRTYGGEGYAHILEDVVPVMRRKGMSAAEIDAILIENPARVLALAEPS